MSSHNVGDRQVKRSDVFFYVCYSPLSEFGTVSLESHRIENKSHTVFEEF